jgi:diguanylate cyclase (GGDEF)-like protein
MSPARWAVWDGVLLGGGAAVFLSVRTLVVAPPSWREGAGVLLLGVLAWFGDRWPVPIAVKGGGEMALSAVAVACAAVMYGAAVAVLIASTSIGFELARCRRHPVKIAFNACSYALMGGAGGLAAHIHPGSRVGLVVTVLLAAGAMLVTNIGLYTLMVAHAKIREAAAGAWSILKVGLLPVLLSLSVAPVFIICWRSDPYIAVLAAVPVFVVGLYLRSLERSRQATQLALTDPLTGLGNRRRFGERLDRELDCADATGKPMSVCLFDVDSLKVINDRDGHDRGDSVLVTVAGMLRHDGEAFRLGGDEFVLLLPGHDCDAAATVAAAVQARVNDVDLGVSVGTATYQNGDPPRTDLLRAADRELYARKRSIALN